MKWKIAAVIALSLGLTATAAQAQLVLKPDLVTRIRSVTPNTLGVCGTKTFQIAVTETNNGPAPETVPYKSSFLFTVNGAVSELCNVDRPGGLNPGQSSQYLATCSIYLGPCESVNCSGPLPPPATVQSKVDRLNDVDEKVETNNISAPFTLTRVCP